MASHWNSSGSMLNAGALLRWVKNAMYHTHSKKSHRSIIIALIHLWLDYKTDS